MDDPRAIDDQAGMDGELGAAGIERHEIPVGPNRLIVVYLPPDLGIEIDAVSTLEMVGADAGMRAAEGWELTSLDSLNLRHSGLYVGRDGSGYETKLAIVALFSRTGAG